MISPQLLAILRAKTAAFLTDTCVLKRPQKATDEFGFSGLEAYSPVERRLQCRILPLRDRSSQDLVGESEMGRTYFRLIVPYDTDLLDGDQIEHNGATYEIQQVEDAHTSHTDRRARIVRLGNG